MTRPRGMQKQHSTALAAVALLALVTACGTQTGSGSGGGGSVAPDVPVTGVHWVVDSVTVDGRKTAAPAGAHVEIDSKGVAKGTTGCNQFRADVTVAGDTLTVKPGETTEIGCPPEVQAFESALNGAFSGTLKAKLDDDRLTLTTREGDTIALTSQPPAPLHGTTWKVTSLTSGDTATSLPAGTEGKAHFVFGKDGSVSGTLGCNRFNTTAKASGSTLTFGRVVTTRMLCPDPQMDLENALLKVFESKATYQLQHRGLSLTAPNGKGLAAVAEDARQK